MKKCFFILAYLFFSLGIISGQQDKKPRLIVGIIIDQMRYDVLQKYWNKFENNGFKRLINEGTVCRNAHYNFLVSRPCVSYTSIVTGANPSIHGIVSDDWYMRVSDKIAHCTRDTSYSTLGGSFESGRHTPKQILVTSIGDELRMHTSKSAKVISVSLDASNAVLAGGHAPNASYWLDTETGNMVTSSYFVPVLSRWVDDFNKKKLAEAYLDRSWELMNPSYSYFDSASIMNDDYLFRGQKRFPYDLRKASTIRDKRSFGLLKHTPFGINFLKDFAIASIVNEQMGKDEIPDILLVGFTSTGAVAQTFGLNSMEMEDTYLRLDKEIRYFLDFLDSYVGKGNTLIFLTSSQGGTYSPQFMQKYGMTNGFFNSYQALALTRSYLTAMFGADYIKYYNNLQFYLNKNKIRDAKKSFEAIQQEMASFLSDFTGVSHVMTAADLLHQNYSEGVNQKIQHSFYPKRSGDIIISLEPGWVEKKIDGINFVSANNNETHVPLIWYGWKVKKKVIQRDIDIIDIAPTLSGILDVSYPNGCQGKPILEIIE